MGMVTFQRWQGRNEISCNAENMMMPTNGKIDQRIGIDAVKCHSVTSYTFLHLEQGWNEHDDTKKMVCDKIITRAGMQVPWCVDKSFWWRQCHLLGSGGIMVRT